MKMEKTLMVKCYPDSMITIMPDEDEPLCIIQTDEPFTPSSSSFSWNNQKYVVIKCLPYPDKVGGVSWMAVVKSVLDNTIHNCKQSEDNG